MELYCQEKKKKSLICQTKWTCNCSTPKGSAWSRNLCHQKTDARELRFPEDSSHLLSKQWTSGSGQNWGCPQAVQGTDPLPEQQNLLFLSSKTGQGQQTTGYHMLLPSRLSQTRVVWFLSDFFPEGSFHCSPVRATLELNH